LGPWTPSAFKLSLRQRALSDLYTCPPRTLVYCIYADITISLHKRMADLISHTIINGPTNRTKLLTADCFGPSLLPKLVALAGHSNRCTRGLEHSTFNYSTVEAPNERSPTTRLLARVIQRPTRTSQPQMDSQLVNPSARRPSTSGVKNDHIPSTRKHEHELELVNLCYSTHSSIRIPQPPVAIHPYYVNRLISWLCIREQCIFAFG